ncbi:MAG: hypothetical protein IJD22_07490, partial [Clostridia bacterium]|nr:hypothetical protein [Clostridia bacterium]
AGVLVVAVLFAGKGIPDALGSDFLGLGLLLLRILPVQLIVCTLQFFMFELCSSIISGTFLQLVATVALSLVSGFFYPKQSLPESVSAFGSVTPTGCAFTYMTDVFSGRGGWLSLAAVLLWAAVFAALSCIVRMRKIRGVEE